MLNSRIEKYLLIFLSLFVGAGMCYLALVSPGAEGGMDSYNHYMISRFSWKYPSELLLDQWGKPIYNILASPFAQFGFFGVELFNILLLIGTSWLVYFTAKAYKLKYAFLAAVIVMFCPIFMHKTISGLTEPLSAFLLISVVFLFAKDKVVPAAILTGFLPYARSEGYVIMAVVGFYILFQTKSWKLFAYLLLGSVVMNFLGWIVEGDPLWIYNSNPYIKVEVQQKSTCGSGGLFHYVKALGWTFTKLASLLFAVGAGVLGIRFFKDPGNKRNAQLFFLVFGVFALYFLVHTLIWYYGKMGSCGYERVMIVIAPLLAVIAAYGWEWISDQINTYVPKYAKRIDAILLVLMCVYFIAKPYKIYGHQYPIQITGEMEEYVKVAEWYKQQDYDDRHKFYLYPYLHILIDGDPRDHDHFTDLWSLDMKYAPMGSIVIWDSHFGPNECNLPLTDLQNHPDLREIKNFIPKERMETVHGVDFEIHIFERIGDSEMHPDFK